MLINNQNSVVTDSDNIYHLGDFAIIKNISDAKNVIYLVKKLNGRKIFIQDNHDTKLIKNKEFRDAFEEVTIYKKINDKLQ